MKNVSPHWSFEVLLNYFEARAGEEVLEHEMIKDFFPEEEAFSGGITLELFEKHFFLRRRLYLFDDELRLKTGQRISIRLIRFRLLPPPPPGHCSWLVQEQENYCGLPAPDGLCVHHSRPLLGAELEDPGVRGFYMDWKNLNDMNEDRLKRLVDSFFQQVFHPQEQHQAFTMMGLEPGAPSSEIRSRWIELSKKHHPDAGGDLETYQKISAAYQLLKGL